MTIKADQLEEYESRRFEPNQSVAPLEEIKEAIAAEATTMRVPLAFKYDYVQSGGLLNKVKDEALIVLHGEHPKDYYKYILYYSHTKYGTVLKIGISGTSKHRGKLAV